MSEYVVLVPEYKMASVFHEPVVGWRVFHGTSPVNYGERDYAHAQRVAKEWLDSYPSTVVHIVQLVSMFTGDMEELEEWQASSGPLFQIKTNEEKK